MPKSIIKQELKPMAIRGVGVCFLDTNTFSAIRKALKELKKKAYCNYCKSNAKNSCLKHKTEMCVRFHFIEEVFGEVKDAKNK